MIEIKRSFKTKAYSLFTLKALSKLSSPGSMMLAATILLLLSIFDTN